MNNEAEKSPVRMTTSTFKFKRNTKGIMNFATDSPSRSVVWAKDTPVKEHISIRLKSQDLSQVSPKPSVKKFISSPLLTVPNYSDQILSPNTLARKAQIDQRLCEEFEKLDREVNKVVEYKPRNILDNLNETSQKERAYESKSKSTGNLCTNANAIMDDDYDEMDDIEFLTQLENEARKKLNDKASRENNPLSNSSNVNEIISKMESKNEILKQQQKNDKNLIHEEDDIDEMMLSIPFECLVDPNFNATGTNALPKPTIEPPKLLSFPQKSSTKRQLNKTDSSVTDRQPVIKKIFTKEECEQKRLEALKRRQELLKKRQQDNGK
ncbi:hypothetical protein PVAND_002893 [Polypedilum vanderplanki]|uniref:Uncharacterized protein n=1 Tax=Polypedilum vanderplanki TaxID=319348 RepID=A0A9J6BSX1_POLVA|nr:hypothetical protein PVAND_002893 [Polypedilum vanderplanki]